MKTSTDDISIGNTATTAHEIEDASHNADRTSGRCDCGVTPVAASTADRSDRSSARFSIASSAMEEEEEYPKTQQEELNEILEAFYELISDEQIRSYQKYIEEIERQSLASKAVQAPEKAPDFEMVDQDGEMVRLSDHCKKGPVILVFYRGKWCPHCNAVVINLRNILPEIQAKGASIIAISPMLPDGTAVFATKRCLQFPVLSDVGNTVARQFRLTFQVPTQFRSMLISFGENFPQHTGDDSWEIPLPATYIIDQDGSIVWSFIDDDQHYRAEPADILAAIPTKAPPDDYCDDKNLKNPCNMINRRTAKAPPLWRRATLTPTSPQPPTEELPRDSISQHSQHSSDTGSMGGSDTSSRRRKSIVMRLFGRKKQEPMEFLGSYVCND